MHLGLALVDVDARGEQSSRRASASASAASSTTGPRAVFTSTAVGFMSASRRASMRWRVSGSSGTCSDTTSARRSSSSRSPTSIRGIAGVGAGVVQHLHAEAGGAAAPRPSRCGRNPTTPSVAPCTSWPRYCVIAHPGQRSPRRSRFGLGREPRRGEDQQEREVGGRLVEHAGRVAHRDAALGRGRARRCCRSRRRRSPRPSAGRRRAASSTVGVDAVGEQAHHRVDVGDRGATAPRA